MRSNFPPNRGFTFIEMAVALGIVAVFGAMTLASYPKFSNRTTLALLAQNIALSVREAQAYGLGVRNSGNIGNPFPAYGIHVDSTNRKAIVLFADLDNDYRYDDPGELVRRFLLPAGATTMSDYCINNASGGGQCGKTALDITFKSPKPDGRICANGDATPCASNIDGEIVISNAVASKTIIVRTTGQISVP